MSNPNLLDVSDIGRLDVLDPALTTAYQDAGMRARNLLFVESYIGAQLAANGIDVFAEKRRASELLSRKLHKTTARVDLIITSVIGLPLSAPA
jgi:hypothetical protein